MVSYMGWSANAARLLAQLLEERGVSLRTLADSVGHSHNYWHQRLRPDAKTSMSLEDIETVCGYLSIDPQSVIRQSWEKSQP